MRAARGLVTGSESGQDQRAPQVVARPTWHEFTAEGHQGQPSRLCLSCKAAC